MSLKIKAINQYFPYDIVLQILQYDDNFVINNRKIRIINKISKTFINTHFDDVNHIINTKYIEFEYSNSEQMVIHVYINKDKFYSFIIYNRYHEEVNENNEEIVVTDIARKIFLCRKYISELLIEY